MAPRSNDSGEAARIRNHLARLEGERDALQARLAELETKKPVAQSEGSKFESVTERSPAHEKIALFRSLFRGRADVYPKRWENDRTGKAGYAPACGNEWKPQVCGKPKIKCGSCTNQAFP